MRRTLVGGSAMPRSLIAKFMDTYQVEVRHGWGMTETTAAATMGGLMPAAKGWPAEEKHAHLAKQGRTMFGVEIKVVDEQGATLPRDGESQGELMVRGQWVLSSYFKADRSPLVDGWFPTGDIATISPDGVMQIRDRTKDVIKTGGEWISSIDLESAAVAHPAVAMAAVIGVKHPKWDERPLMFIVRKPGHALEKDEILKFLETQVAKWWVPDDVVFLESLPVGGTGKVQKGDLRKQYGSVFS
jgi:fatty-acyl-CoA synthase